MKTPAAPATWLGGVGAMSELVRELDWSQTPLGAIDTWPISLRTIVSLMLSSKQPMFLWWGPELIQIYNDAYVPSFDVGKHPRALGQPGKECWTETWHIVGPQIDAVRRSGEPCWYEDALVPVTRNGRLEDVYWTYGYSAVYDESSHVAGVLVICMETTHRVLARRHEADARSLADRERAQLLRLFEQAPAGICLLRGPAFVFEFANEQYCRLVGRADLVGKPLLTALPELRGQGFDVLLGNVLTSNTAHFGNEVLARLAVDGDPSSLSDVYVTFIYSSLLGADGEGEGVAVFAFDVTEQVTARKKLETLAENLKESHERAEAANRAKDDFLATASHELRTPLNAILGWARLLRSGKLEPAKATQALKTIERNAGTQVRMVEDILDGARIITGKLRLDMSAVDLVEVASAAIEAIRPAAEAKRIQLTAELDPHAAYFVGDAERLQQVVSNLCNNAVKFTPAGGSVSVRLARADQGIELSVTDSGVGMAPDLLPRVFDRFVQAERATTRRHGGLGLGLALVRHLVEAHGGSVRAQSEGAGRGSTFSVYLPTVLLQSTRRAPAEPRSSPTASVSALSLAGIHVLLVDDDADAREFTTTLLQQRHAEVTAVDSGRKALSLLETVSPTVLVSDIGMPDLDGYALLRQVRAAVTSHDGYLPAIALTAYARELDRQLALAAGFDEYLPKPLDAEALVSIISQLAARAPSSRTVSNELSVPPAIIEPGAQFR